MTFSYIIIPLIAALMGALLVFIFLKYLFKQFPKFWPTIATELTRVIEQQFLTEANVSQLFDQLDLESQMKPLLEVRMDGFVDGMKKNNPAIGFFLSPSLLEGFKDVARAEFNKLIPEVKEMVSKKVVGSDTLRMLIEEKITQIDLRPLQNLLWDKFAKNLIAVGAFGGLLIGLVALGLMILLGAPKIV